MPPMYGSTALGTLIFSQAVSLETAQFRADWPLTGSFFRSGDDPTYLSVLAPEKQNLRVNTVGFFVPKVSLRLGSLNNCIQESRINRPSKPNLDKAMIQLSSYPCVRVVVQFQSERCFNLTRYQQLCCQRKS